MPAQPFRSLWFCAPFDHLLNIKEENKLKTRKVTPSFVVMVENGKRLFTKLKKSRQYTAIEKQNL
jgi:hypothetical protein